MEVLAIKKILVIQTAFLGDAILTLPMLQRLKEKFSDAHISVLCIPSTKEIFEACTAVDNVVEYDKHGKEKSLLSYAKLIKKLRNENFAEIYSPHRSLRSTLIAYFANVKTTIGFDNSAAKFLYDEQVKYLSDIHEVARNLKLIGEYIGDEKWRVLPSLSISASASKKVKDILAGIKNEKIIAIAPGSVWETKKYPQNYYEDVIQYLISKKYYIILIGGKEDASFCEAIENKFDLNVKSFAGSLTVIESIEMLKNVHMLISNDSAPTHMAMAADIPTLTIYCSTVSSFGFYPYNKKSQYISYDDLECKPCGIHGHNRCPITTFDCGVKLLPKIVIHKISEMLTS